MSSTLSPNMSLVIPTVGSEAGPQYAQDINNSLTIVDGHNHTPGSGSAITPAAININADLTFGGYKAINVAALALVNQTTLPTAAGSLYSKLGAETVPLNDLFYFDGTNQVQLTSGGLVNATIASLPGESYNAGVFSWKQGAGSTTPANFDIGSVVIRPAVASTAFGTTLAPNSALASAFTLSLPASLPLAAGSLLTGDTTGNLSWSTVDGSSLQASGGTLSVKPQGIAQSMIANNAVGPNQLAAPKLYITGSSGLFNSNSPSATQIPNFSQAIVSAGRPVELSIQSDGNSASSIGVTASQGIIVYYRNGVEIARSNFQNTANSGSQTMYVPQSSFRFIDVAPAAGNTYTYSMSVITGGVVYVFYCNMVVREL